MRKIKGFICVAEYSDEHNFRHHILLGKNISKTRRNPALSKPLSKNRLTFFGSIKQAKEARADILNSLSFIKTVWIARAELRIIENQLDLAYTKKNTDIIVIWKKSREWLLLGRAVHNKPTLSNLPDTAELRFNHLLGFRSMLKAQKIRDLIIAKGGEAEIAIFTFRRIQI